MAGNPFEERLRISLHALTHTLPGQMCTLPLLV